MRRLDDRVVIVTGAGGLIGRGIALRLAREGAQVVCASRTPAKAESTAREIEEAGGRAVAVAVDISNQSSVEALVARTIETFGRIDALVNNAASVDGPDLLKGFQDTVPQDWDAQLDVSLRGTMLCCHAVLPHMIAQNSGRIVNITSAAGKSTSARVSLYAAAKAGVAGFTRALARDVGRYGILVNAIAPGPIASSEDASNPSDMLQRIAKTTVLHRVGVPEDVAAMVALLVSDDGNFITAQQISVDGGGTSSH